MKKIILALLLGLLTNSAIAGISVIDSIKGSQRVGIESKTCADQILKIDRKKYVVPYIQDKILPLEQVTNGRVFYHYTNAEVLVDILQEKNGIESIMRHSYESSGENVAGRGLYLAGNPFSSISYGEIQASFKIGPNARVLQLNIDAFLTFIGNLIQRELTNNCKTTFSQTFLQTLILQENGVDLYLYDDPMMWYLLVNEDVLEENQVLFPIYNAADLVAKMSHAKRLDEIDVKLFKNERPLARSEKNFYSMEDVLSRVCERRGIECYKQVLATLLQNGNFLYLDAFIAHKEFLLDEYSILFNLEVKKGNGENSDSMLKISCKYNFSDALIDKAPLTKKKNLKRKIQELCLKQ